MAALPLFPTQIVGSWTKPKWLANHELFFAPENTWWRVPEEQRAEALDDATLLAIYDQERAGLTYVTDGEQRRQTFSGYFNVLGGIDSVNRAEYTLALGDIGNALTMKSRPAAAAGSDKPATGGAAPAAVFKPTVPQVTGPVTWNGPILGRDLEFLRNNTTHRTKMTIIGPCSLALRLADAHYGSPAKLAFGIADALNQELRYLEAAGVDMLQIDEPEAHFRYSQCRDYAVEAINRTIRGIEVPTAVHVCYGYSKNIAAKQVNPVYEKSLELLAATDIDEISLEYEQPGHTPEILGRIGDKAVILGLLNLDTEAPVEAVDHIVERTRAAMQVVPAGRLRLASDCGMWFLPRERALGKARALEAAARVLRGQVG
jgi:5-methyltetrahydropteroyltriglutamate--homocysteine methyltransferase